MVAPEDKVPLGRSLVGDAGIQVAIFRRCDKEGVYNAAVRRWKEVITACLHLTRFSATPRISEQIFNLDQR